MDKDNKVGTALMCGAATALGSIIVQKLFSVMDDPQKRAGMKRKFKNVKDKIIKPKEEP